MNLGAEIVLKFIYLVNSLSHLSAADCEEPPDSEPRSLGRIYVIGR